MNSLLRMIIKNSSLTLASSIISQILLLFFYSLIAKNLTSESFGLITFNLTTIQLFAILSSGGIGLAIAKFISEKKDNVQNEKEVISISLKLNVIFIFISLLTMVLFKKQLKIEFNYATSILMFIGVVAISIDALLKSILIGKQDFSSLAKITIYNSIITFCINILCFYLFGEPYLFITLSISYFFSFFFSFYFLSQHIKGISILNFAELKTNSAKTIFKFTLPLLVANLIVIFTNWFLQFDLNKTGNLKDLAVLGVINQLLNICLFVPVIYGKVIMPILSENYQKNNFVLIKRILYISVLTLTIIFTFLIIFQNFFLFILEILFSNKYSLNNVYDKVILVSFLASLSSLIGNFLAANAKMFFGFFLNIIWSLVVLYNYKTNQFENNIENILFSLIYGYLLIFIMGIVYISMGKYIDIFKKFLISIYNIIPPRIIKPRFHKEKDFILDNSDNCVFVLIDYDLFNDRKEKKVGKVSYKCGVKTLDYAQEFCIQKNIDFYRIITTDDKLKISENVYLNNESYILNEGTDICVIKSLLQLIKKYKNICVINSSCAYSDIKNIDLIYSYSRDNFFNYDKPYIIGFNANSNISPKLPMIKIKYPHVITNAFLTRVNEIELVINSESSRNLFKYFNLGFENKYFSIRYFEIYLSRLILSKQKGNLYMLIDDEIFSYIERQHKWPLIDSRLFKFGSKKNG